MQHPAAYIDCTFTAHQYQNERNSSGTSGDSNLQFFKQTFQQPLQYGLAGFGGQPATDVIVKTLSSTSTKRWPSNEQYPNSSSGSICASNSPTIAGLLPIRELQHLIDLENRVVSVQQYEHLLAHLQVLTIRHQGSVSEMFRNFITDSVLGRVGFARPKNGKYDCTMRTDFQRIMMAIKASWFPDKDQESFEAQMTLLLKNAHSRNKTKANDNDPPPQPASPTSTKGQHQETVTPIKVEYQQIAANPINPVVQPTVATPAPQQILYQFQQNQWYQYALYYRDRYQIAKKANQKMKADYTEQEKEYKKRISGCLKRVRAMQHYMNVLEKRVQRLE